MIETIVFAIAALMILVGAVGVIVHSHPVHAALGLVLTLFGVAVQFVAMEAHFLAAVQVIVYAGAIVVLFLFVIMLLGVARRGPAHRTPPDPAATGCRAGTWQSSACSSPVVASATLIRWRWARTPWRSGAQARRPETCADHDANIRQLANLLRRQRVRLRAHVGAADRRRCGHGRATRRERSKSAAEPDRLSRDRRRPTDRPGT